MCIKQSDVYANETGNTPCPVAGLCVKRLWTQPRSCLRPKQSASLQQPPAVTPLTPVFLWALITQIIYFSTSILGDPSSRFAVQLPRSTTRSCPVSRWWCVIWWAQRAFLCSSRWVNSPSSWTHLHVLLSSEATLKREKFICQVDSRHGGPSAPSCHVYAGSKTYLTSSRGCLTAWMWVHMVDGTFLMTATVGKQSNGLS